MISKVQQAEIAKLLDKALKDWAPVYQLEQLKKLEKEQEQKK